MKIVQKLLGWLEWPINLMLWIALLAGVAMMLHVAADVTGRTVFNSPIQGTTEIVSGWYMVACAFLPLAWITRNDNHIVAGVFQQIGSKKFAYWLEVAVRILLLVYMAVFTWQTYLRAVQQTRAGEVWQAAGRFIDIWPARWLLPLSGALIILYLILRVISDVSQGLRGTTGDRS